MRGGFRKGVGLNPKQLSQQMKQMGISIEELSDVEEVVIRTADAELVFEARRHCRILMTVGAVVSSFRRRYGG